MAIIRVRQSSSIKTLFSLLKAPHCSKQCKFRRGIIGSHRCLSTQKKSDDDKKFDIVVVGAGIIGMATARELTMRYPHLKLCVVDKENSIAAHQSSHNSGVIHAGIYYTPGSLKAKLCVEGLKLAYQYCDQHNIPYKKCGKLIVATTSEECERLDVLYQKGLQNEVPDLRLISGEEIQEVEPYCRGLKAIHSPVTGIVDWAEVTRSYAKNFTDGGGTIKLGFNVNGFKPTIQYPEYPVTVTSQSQTQDPNIGQGRVFAKYVITCGGLYSDKLATKSGCQPLPKIVPFRGEYLLLKPEKTYLVRGNIYPVPDPKFPFLGVHFTPRINGDVWLGPNAVLAFKREGYKLSDFSVSDLADSLAFSGLRKLVFGNMSYAFGELYRGVNTSAQVKVLQKFMPELRASDVTRGPAGVRAQALGPDGKLVDDFIFDSAPGVFGKKTLHVRNAPSPAATSSLAIAKLISDKAQEQFALKG